jgi:hypothetical protein
MSIQRRRPCLTLRRIGTEDVAFDMHYVDQRRRSLFEALRVLSHKVARISPYSSVASRCEIAWEEAKKSAGVFST